MNRVLSILLNLIIISFSSFSQIDTTKINYHPPLDIPLILSANFGELRPNHFHMGIDFKTNGVEGLKLYSIEDGYVSRIKISAFGYGKVVYINHPNGITSVYAHCSALIGKLDSLVKITQEKEMNFEVEIFPKPDEITIKKGENFALSGNTGSSTAPHLHFELRNTKTETALNPLVFGFDIIDTKAPEIKSMKIYALTKEGYRIKGKSKIVPVQKGKYGYYIGGNMTTLPSDFCSPSGGIGLAFETVDYYDKASNSLGIYRSYLLNNKDTIFGQKIDSVSFDNTKQINTHCDYEEFSSNKRKFQKSFKTNSNPLTIYEFDNLGIIKVAPLDSIDLTFISFDSKGNQSKLTFKINILAGPTNNLPYFISKNYLYPDSSFNISTKKEKIIIQKGTVYEPIPINIPLIKGTNIGTASSSIQKPISIFLPLPENNKVPIEKLYISSNSHYLTSKFVNGWLSAESKSLGNFSVKFDTIAPSIAPLNFMYSDSICKKMTLHWKITENKTILSDYDLFIDGNWVLLEFESKGHYAFYRRPKDLIGKHLFKLIAKDICGNVAVWEKEIILEF
jgi:hypothetical protein